MIRPLDEHPHPSHLKSPQKPHLAPLPFLASPASKRARQNRSIQPNVHLNTPRGLMAHLLNLWKPTTSKKTSKAHKILEQVKRVGPGFTARGMRFLFHSDLARMMLTLHRDLHHAHDEENMSKRHRWRFRRFCFLWYFPPQHQKNLRKQNTKYRNQSA